MQQVTHRADIDGLRAISVVAVLFFHLGLLPGGFIGVDAFFVISGYLITRNLLNEVRRGSFSLWRFYERRIRRIVPVLSLVIAATLVVGTFLLVPDDLTRLGRQAATAIVGVSNVYFMTTAGYFAPAATSFPLLHTWSLGVEEQFYLLWPAIIWLLVEPIGLKRRGLLVAFAVLTVASFACSVWQVGVMPKDAFYLLPGRAWELALGGLVALLPTMRTPLLSALTAGLGVLCLAASAFLLNATDPFPGLAALPPCIGTALVVIAGDRQGVGAWLGWRPMAIIGLMSYSIYLWHWPVIVFAGYALFDLANPLALAALVASTLLLSLFSYRFVENPARRAKLSRGMVYGAAAGVVLVLMSCGVFLHFAKGLPQRLSFTALEYAAAADDISPYRNACHRLGPSNVPISDSCTLGDMNAVPTWAVWGDSHAVELANGLGDLLSVANAATMQFTYSACPPGAGVDFPLSLGCRQHNDAVLDFILRTPSMSNVVMTAYYSGQPEDLLASAFQQAVATLTDAGRRVYILGPTPEFRRSVPEAAAFAVSWRPDVLIAEPTLDFLRRNSWADRLLDALEADPLVQVFRPQDVLCDEIRCWLLVSGTPLLFDEHHLSNRGARLLLDEWRDILPIK